MPGRQYSAGNGYRYGFNGKENDNEVKGEGNQQDYGMRIYDPRLGRFLSVDPLMKTYPYYTPYQFASNSPILAIDVDGLESSNDKTTTSLAVPPATPNIDPTQIKTYKVNSPWAWLTHLGIHTNVNHSHASTINEAYENSGGDKASGNAKVISNMNLSLKPVQPGSIIQDPRSPRAVTNLNTAYYSSGESGSQKNWVNLLLGGFIKGTIPENIVFSENGTVSSYLKGSFVYNEVLEMWDKAGRPSNDNRIYGFNYGLENQLGDRINHNSFNSISNFVGSAMATVLSNPNDNTITLTITNITSVHSGDYSKHFGWHSEESPFLYRDPSKAGAQPYTNFSQTYRLKLQSTEVIKKLDDKKKYSGPVY